MPRFAPLLVLLLLAGCGGPPSKPATVPAGGTATYKGQVPAEALIVFHPVDPALGKRMGGTPFGKVKDDGTFTLTTYAEGDGAPEGEYSVTVEWKPAGAAKMSLSSEGGNLGADKLGGRYGNPADPKFKFTVKKGEPNKFELKLD